MADDLKNRGPADQSRVNVHEPWELDWWARKWGVTAAQLKGAVARVGVMAHSVAAMLGKTM
jgi:Protein of unknown function (DUF3606)